MLIPVEFWIQMEWLSKLNYGAERIIYRWVTHCNIVGSGLCFYSQNWPHLTCTKNPMPILFSTHILQFLRLHLANFYPSPWLVNLHYFLVVKILHIYIYHCILWFLLKEVCVLNLLIFFICRFEYKLFIS